MVFPAVQVFTADKSAPEVTNRQIPEQRHAMNKVCTKNVDAKNA
jgi:hypothetical protein